MLENKYFVSRNGRITNSAFPWNKNIIEGSDSFPGISIISEKVFSEEPKF